MFSKSFQKIQTRTFFITLLGVFALTVYMIAPFLTPLLWAAILASVFYPLNQKIQSIIKNENASSLITTTFIVLIVLVPVSVVAVMLVREMVGVYEYLSDPETVNTITSFVEAQRESGAFKGYMEGLEVEERIRDIFSTVASSLLAFVRQGSATTLSFIAKLFVMLYTLFYLLRDGKKLLLKVERLLPFGDDNERRLFEKFTSTSRATLKGTVFIAIIQAIIAGSSFLAVGLPAVVFLTIVAGFLALIPALGATLIVVPAAVYLFFTAPLWQGVLLLVAAVVINVSDNILRPVLAGSDIAMHPAVFLFATLGGLALFGVSGVVFGPVVMAFLLAMLEIYETRYKRDIDKEAGAKS
ncbi:MAG: AI-2E family transporter [Candidatus Campbellbacteria bacterium]|nr:AI-2E family transporter [Candidatus Campbellbacteria bacterium]